MSEKHNTWERVGKIERTAKADAVKVTPPDPRKPTTAKRFLAALAIGLAFSAGFAGCGPRIAKAGDISYLYVCSESGNAYESFEAAQAACKGYEHVVIYKGYVDARGFITVETVRK